MFSVLLRGTSQ